MDDSTVGPRLVVDNAPRIHVPGLFIAADDIPAAPERPIVDGLAYGGAAVGIVGREGSGKSTLLRAAAGALSLGRHLWTGEPVEPRVTYWIGEERPGQWRSKLDRFPHHPKRVRFSPFVLDYITPAGLWDACRQYRVGMVVFDPAFCLLGKVGNEYGQELRQHIQPWLPPDDGPAVVMVLHAHRERELRRDAVSHYHGSVAWGAVLDALIDWERPDDLTDARRTLAVSGKSRIDGLPSGRRTTLQYCRDEDGDGYIPVTAPEPTTTTGAPDLVERIGKWRAARPAGQHHKTRCAADLGIRRGGGSPAYRAFLAAWESAS